MSDNLLKDLNNEQIQAATHTFGPMLILAGAGSGKTKTITTRLAYLISTGVDPSSILTLTFTNKAANEMKKRAFDMIGQIKLSSMPLLCTFHKFGLIFLKMYITKLNRKPNFIVIDKKDKQKILKDFKSSISTSILSEEISNKKNALISPLEAITKHQNGEILFKNTQHLYSNDDYLQILTIYQQYENYMVENNLVDFDDLLVLPYKILDNDPILAKEISKRYEFIMVDEYQDTNELQLKLLKKLTTAHKNIVVVGDDDQSIYSWRGARIENILNFEMDFEGSRVVKLEKNYRSYKQILDKANELIGCNQNRHGKTLIATKLNSNKGPIIDCLESEEDRHESNKIINKINELKNKGENFGNIAILYRVNILSRSIESALKKAEIPYKIISGISFFERSEIKDIIAYIRVVLNTKDDFSMKRIINRPKRGIGDITIAKIEKIAFENRKSIIDTIDDLDTKIVSSKIYQELKDFKGKINKLANMSKPLMVDSICKTFGLYEFYENQEDALDRIYNMKEFINSIKYELENNEDFDFEDYLNNVLLKSDQDNLQDGVVSLMSIHASKGLEFDHVFIIGLEEGYFPIIGDYVDIEEERRLAYVAITRAKKTLTLSSCRKRAGKVLDKRSRFLQDLGFVSNSQPKYLYLESHTIEKSNSYKKGDTIKHKIFGFGRVISTVNEKGIQKLTINFGGIERKIMSNFVEKVI